MQISKLLQDEPVNSQQLDCYRERGYTNDDLLPKPKEKRTMSALNFCTLWMQSVHNIPNYAAVGAFLIMGYSPMLVMLGIMLGAILTAIVMSVNGVVGSKYGIPFSMHLRATYGKAGAQLPGFLRGVVAAICWYGIQTYIGAKALEILVGKICPEFLTLGSKIPFVGSHIPIIISFLIFWLLNLAIGLGGGGALNKLTVVLSPLIYIVFGCMSVWAISCAGGLSAIMQYHATVQTPANCGIGLFMMMIVNSVLGVWAAPAVSIADFTQNAKSTVAQVKGQVASFLLSYALFAFTSVVILVGGSLFYHETITDVLVIINKWDNLPAIAVATGLLLLTTVCTNATGNIVPAAYQLTALAPRFVNYKRGVIIAAIVSTLLMPWKFMANITGFLNIIGMLLGPIAGVLLADYYIVKHCKIDLDQLYYNTKDSDLVKESAYSGTNLKSYISTILALLLALSGQFIPAFASLTKISWIVGFAAGFVLQVLLSKLPKLTKLTNHKN
ncbi:allantoin permease [Gardnerella vaginalis]|uniref:allantoin permease n=1 Tax=Gardnerella vaginalis TaxID=2702 RepID=UPI0039EEF7BC